MTTGAEARPRTVDQDWNLLYSTYPDVYDQFSEHQDGYDAVAKRVYAVAGVHGKVLLDVGGGTGRYARRFAPDAAAVICAEPNASMLEYARTRSAALGHTNITFYLAPAQELPLESESVDIALAAHSLTAISAREVKQGVLAGPSTDQRLLARRVAVEEILRALRPGGWLFSLSPSPDQYGGEMCDIILGANRAEWSAGKRRFLDWLSEEYGADSARLDCDWVFGSVEQAAEVFGFVYGDAVRDFIVRNELTTIRNELVLQTIVKATAP